MLNSVIKSKVFSEYSESEKYMYFTINEKRVEPHIDNIYYSVFIQGDSHDPDKAPEGLADMINDLYAAREEKLKDFEKEVMMCGLNTEPTGFSIYRYHLSDPDNFDVFISSYLPNDNTSRIHVQIRTRLLMLRGANNSVLDSFAAVEKLLNEYGLFVGKVSENRIDYAYHTNIIQKPNIYISDEMLENHLNSELRLIHKVGRLCKKLEWEYCGIGNRKSNNVFCRIYNKSQEVIRENYKSFFFEYWRRHGLISFYDQYCYEKAYEMKSYKTGLLVGRIFFYLEYGHDENLKEELRQLYESCNLKSENNKQIEEKLNGLLPPVTLIMNVEFETKRSFYRSLKEYLQEKEFYYDKSLPVKLFDIFKTLNLREQICSYLTEDTVCFLNNREELKSGMMDWWRRIHNAKCRIMPVEEERELGDIMRSYERKTTVKRTLRDTKNQLAQTMQVSRDSLDPADPYTDVTDLINLLNDNSKKELMVIDTTTGAQVELNFKEYDDIWLKKARRNKGIIGKIDLDEKARQEKIRKQEEKDFEFIKEFETRQKERGKI